MAIGTKWAKNLLTRYINKSRIPLKSFRTALGVKKSPCAITFSPISILIQITNKYSAIWKQTKKCQTIVISTLMLFKYMSCNIVKTIFDSGNCFDGVIVCMFASNTVHADHRFKTQVESKQKIKFIFVNLLLC